MPKANKADPFDVWGKPPPGVLRGMKDKQIAQLKTYIGGVAKAAYRLAYDLGKEQRDRINRNDMRGGYVSAARGFLGRWDKDRD